MSPLQRGTLDVPVRVVDGAKFDDFRGFCAELSKALDDAAWDGSIDTLPVLLRNPLGASKGMWILKWENSERSRGVLGWDATVAVLAELAAKAEPAKAPGLKHRLAAAERKEGPTLFEMILKVVRESGVLVELR